MAIAITYIGQRRFQKTSEKNHRNFFELLQSKYKIKIYDFIKDAVDPNCPFTSSGGVQVWEQDDLAIISSISANAFDEIYQADNMIDIIDVRKETEYKNRHIISAVFNPLSDLENDKLNSTAENFVHCAGGYRSVIACSLLKREGIHNVTNIEGGFGAIKKTDLPLSEEVCPSTL